jgi:hypothetical protein
LFDDDDGENREIGTDDAASDGFTFAFTGTTGTITRMAFGEEETDTSWMEDTLWKSERETDWDIHSSWGNLVCRSRL